MVVAALGVRVRVVVLAREKILMVVVLVGGSFGWQRCLPVAGSGRIGARGLTGDRFLSADARLDDVTVACLDEDGTITVNALGNHTRVSAMCFALVWLIHTR